MLECDYPHSDSTWPDTIAMATKWLDHLPDDVQHKITVGNGKRGPITEAIQRTFFDIINGEKPDQHSWLTYVYPGEPLQAVGAGGSRAAAKK